MKLVLFLDYDGTLTPIVKRPELARLRLATKKLLERLAKKVTVCIISGRSLNDIKGLVKIQNIIYCGNHGLEIDYYGKVFIHPDAKKFKRRLDKILEILKEKLKNIPGILIEDKDVVLSVHYRNVRKEYIGKIKKVLDMPFGAKITYGKKVFEVRPPVEWDKGFCVKKIMSMSGGRLLPIYIGDDTADEDAFRVIRQDGISIFVGRPKKSGAEYYLRNTKEVTRFLEQLL